MSSLSSARVDSSKERLRQEFIVGIAADWHSVGGEYSEFSPAFDAKRVLFRNKVESLESGRGDGERKLEGVEEGDKLESLIERI